MMEQVVDVAAAASRDAVRQRAAALLPVLRERAFRDIHAARAHVAFDMDAADATCGRIAFGLQSDHRVH